MATAFSSLRARLFALLLLALLLLLAPLAWLSAREAERAASEDLRRALYTRLYLLQAEGVQDEERLLLELFRLAQLVAQVDPHKITGCVLDGGFAMIGGASVVTPDTAQARRYGDAARHTAVIRHC